MKRITQQFCAALSTLSLCSLAAAAQMGGYIGLGVGYGVLSTPSKYYFVPVAPGYTTRSQGGLTGRAFVGLNFTPFFGVEAGYLKYRRSLYVGRQVGAYSSIQLNAHTYDFVLKGYFPFGYTGLNVYALAGAARVVETENFVDNGVPLTTQLAAPTDGYTHARKIRPMYGVGINYSYCHFIVAAEVTQVSKLGTFSSNPVAIPYLRLGTISLAYGFG